MPHNPRPNELPKPVEAYDSGTAPIIVDSYLDRTAVIDLIAQEVGLDDILTADDGRLTHAGLARLYRTVADDDPRGTTVPANTQKHRLIDDLADIYGFGSRGRQDALLKSQLVHILVSEACGESPDGFRLPSDPDGSDYDDVPSLGDA